MKRLFFIVALAISSAILTSCQIDGPLSSGSDVKTSSAKVSEDSVILSGYLYVDASVRSTCQFGILYSTEPEPSKDNGIYKKSVELDSRSKFEVVLRHLIPDTDYYYKAYIKYESGSYQYGDVKSFKTKQVDTLVNLGLSVKWATCNLGATNPEEYGGYFQWGGLQDVSSKSLSLDWNNCSYHTGSLFSTGWTKYIPSDKLSYWSGSGKPDNKKVLNQNDDVAHVKLGGKWRIPTNEEWKELVARCNWTYAEHNGVKGYKVTSKKNGNSIFLPAAGYRDSRFLMTAGYDCLYWSSSLFANEPESAYCAGFDSDENSGDEWDSFTPRYRGLSVRPVSD